MENLVRNRLARLVADSGVEFANDSINRAVGEREVRNFVPSFVRRVENGHVPIEPVIVAAVGIEFGRVRRSKPRKVRRNQMLGIVELADARVRDALHGRAAGGSPICGDHRLPNDKHMERNFRVMLQERFGCGGPPQAERSCGRKEQDEARRICGGVEGGFKVAEILAGQLDERGLSGRRFGRSPKRHSDDEEQ